MQINLKLWNFANCYLQGSTCWGNIPHPFWVVQLAFTFMDICTTRRTGFSHKSTKCHYMTMRLVCGMLRVQLWLLGPFYV